MKAVMFDRIGAPLDVLTLRDTPQPVPGEGEVLVKMVAASVNPGDFLYVQNLYPEPKRPVFPDAVAGNHGVGRIERAGPGVTGLAAGTLVAFSYLDTWAEYAAVPQEWLIRLPDGYPMALGAQMVNLITAWDLVERAKAKPGDWIALTAGHSTVASMTRALARMRGVQVLSIVRHKHEGVVWDADSPVFETEQPAGSLAEHIQQLTGGKGIVAAIDAVGGPLLGELVRSLALGGRAIIYGGYSVEPFTLHNFDVLMRVVTIEHYVYRYFFDPPRPEELDELQSMLRASMAPGFPSGAGGWHALADFHEAVRLSLEQPELGKQFFRM
jgi:NADPH2:quinone reductase